MMIVRIGGLILVSALAGCAGSLVQPVYDEARPLVTVECVKLPQGVAAGAFESCKLISVRPDTPASREQAETLMRTLPTGRANLPSEDRIGGQTLRFQLRPNPQEPAPDQTSGDAPDTPR